MSGIELLETTLRDAGHEDAATSCAAARQELERSLARVAIPGGGVEWVGLSLSLGQCMAQLISRLRTAATAPQFAASAKREVSRLVSEVRSITG
jgi:hypothetical protein